jgi:hypothetical protein
VPWCAHSKQHTDAALLKLTLLCDVPFCSCFAQQPVQYVQTQVPVPVPVPVPVTAAAATATTAVAGAAGVTATPRPRRHLSSGINAPAPAPAAAPQAQPAASSVLAATNLPPPRCPVSASDGRKFLRVVDDIAAACSRPPQHGAPKAEQERFCQECVAPTQAALVTAMLSAISANVTTPAAAADPAVQVACGEAAARALADAGAPVDDAFLEAAAACAGFAARRECPLTSLERRMAPLLAACDLALTTAERGAMAPPGGKKGPAVVGEAEAGAFCADCYWPVFGLIMNEGNLSDTYWCAARNVVLAAQQATAAGATSAGSAPEAAALAALYDPRVAPRFTACLANVQGVAARRAATVTSARDPFASPLARAVSQRCWRRDALLRGTNGLSLVRPELKTRLVALSCPGQDKGDKPILNLEAAKTAGG